VSPKITGWALGTPNAQGPHGRAHLFPLRNRVRPDNAQTALCNVPIVPTSPLALTWEHATVAHIGTDRCMTCTSKAATMSGPNGPIPITLARGLEHAAREAKTRGTKRAPAPDTTVHGAIEVAEVATAKRSLVLAAFRKLGPSTTDEIAHFLGWVHQSTSPRVYELSKAGELEDTGDRRPTERGRPAIVYKATRSPEAQRVPLITGRSLDTPDPEQLSLTGDEDK
jgi:hypothetical protein